VTTQNPSDAQIFAARLKPHRSLNRAQFHVLLLAFGACVIVSSLPFVIMGAWPVAGFMGLDVALVYFAFRANFRAAQAYEDVSVTPVELSLAKVNTRGARREWRFAPIFVRLETREHAAYGMQRIDLVSRGRRVEIAGFLGPDAKADLARDLGRALAEARRGPRWS
jgi:uncharacterized membrane protein